jgi:hypothetical protein
VEEEHSEALQPATTAPVDSTPEIVVATAPQPVPVSQPIQETRTEIPAYVPEPAPVVAAPVAAPIASAPDPVPSITAPSEEISAPSEKPIVEHHHETPYHDDTSHASEADSFQPQATQAYDVVHADPISEPVKAPNPEPVYDPFARPREAVPVEQTVSRQEPVSEVPTVAAKEPESPAEVDREPEAVVSETDENSAAMPKARYDEGDVVSGFNAFLQTEFSKPVIPPPPRKEEDFSWDKPFDDLPELPKPKAFEQALEEKKKEIASDAAAAKQTAKPVGARAELEDLIGFDADRQQRNVRKTNNGDLPPSVTKAVSRLEGKTAFPKKKTPSRFSPVAIAAVVLGVVLLGGVGYAAWQYGGQLTKVVAGLMPGSTTSTPAKTDAMSKQPDAAKTADASKKKPTQVASLEADQGPQKFTQRLMADGTETQTDKIQVDKTLKEGKTVASQTEAGKKVVTADTGQATNQAANADKAAPIGVTQKMFLYEEKLGQTSPVAINGTVSWQVKTETDDTGKSEPEIEGKITVPARGMTALITFKRNTDSSLPASHVIEIVFSLPKDFSDGNVESIQRVAFKQTEQDRGDALIAVPAKITDDFQMVALNDDADARKANLDLMKNRGWIDIPITYRNGRRALITLEKGSTGTDVFDKVMAEWAALGNTADN